MLQNPVHVVLLLVQNKQQNFSFLDSPIAIAMQAGLKNFMFSVQIFAIPSYIESKNPNYEY